MKLHAAFKKIKNIAFNFRAQRAILPTIVNLLILMLPQNASANIITTDQSKNILSKLQDSKYYRETFFWIVDPNGEKVPFKQNSAQAKYYAEKSSNDLILKARKLGFSSEIEGDFVHDCMFIPNTNAVTMAHTADDTKVHMNRIQYYLQTMGTREFPFEVSLDTQNERELYFPETNSYYWSGSAGSTRFGRGRDVSRFHGSEVAHWPDQSVLTAVLDARRRGIGASRTVLETTANGMGEKFAELWFDAEDSKNDSPWKQHFFAWWMDKMNVLPLPPSRFMLGGEETKIAHMVKQIYGVKLSNEQLYWWRRQRAGMADKTLMAQEHPSYPREAFISSGRHIFNLTNLDVMRKQANDPSFVGELEDDENEIRPIANPEGNLTIWKTPREGRKYFMPADVAEGVKDGAWSVAPVFDRASWEVVAELRLRCDPGNFGRSLCTLGEYFNWAVAAPEMNNHGHATLEAMKAKGYPHILKTTDLWPEEVEKLGFPTDERTKEKAISSLRNAIDDFSYFENSKVAIAEIQAAVRDDNGRMVSERAQSAVGGEKKKLYLDCVITRCIGLYCLKFFTLDETYRDSRQSAQNSDRKSTRLNSSHLKLSRMPSSA